MKAKIQKYGKLSLFIVVWLLVMLPLNALAQMDKRPPAPVIIEGVEEEVTVPVTNPGIPADFESFSVPDCEKWTKSENYLVDTDRYRIAVYEAYFDNLRFSGPVNWNGSLRGFLFGTSLLVNLGHVSSRVFVTNSCVSGLFTSGSVSFTPELQTLETNQYQIEPIALFTNACAFDGTYPIDLKVEAHIAELKNTPEVLELGLDGEGFICLSTESVTPTER